MTRSVRERVAFNVAAPCARKRDETTGQDNKKRILRYLRTAQHDQGDIQKASKTFNVTHELSKTAPEIPKTSLSKPPYLESLRNICF